MTILVLLISSLFILQALALRDDQAMRTSIGLYGLLKSKKLNHWLPPVPDHPRDLDHLMNQAQFLDSVHLEAQDGLKTLDKIDALPGQPVTGLPFGQYSGYITVDSNAGKALFYYFVESPTDASEKPLLLWLNGGPGCSSLGAGAMQELGPFRVNNDNRTLYRNTFAWNNVANVIFLESPAGVGFSYSNRTSDYNTTGDASTAKDTYTFLLNWLERFPEYKTRDFFISGESYAGHYVPQLAYLILTNNKNTNHTKINLKGIIIGNGVLNEATDIVGSLEYYWTHALISDETYKGLLTYCGFGNSTFSEKECSHFLDRFQTEIGDIDFYNIYAPLCKNIPQKSSVVGSVSAYDPCLGYYVDSYLNDIKVQTALHAKPRAWNLCGGLSNWTDSPDSVLPEIKHIIKSGVRIWIYSGDVDSVVPVTSTRYSINSLQLPIKTTWRPWYSANEVGGYVVEYEGLTFVTVRGAGHLVPTFQPERALTMISSFLNAVLPPISA